MPPPTVDNPIILGCSLHNSKQPFGLEIVHIDRQFGVELSPHCLLFSCTANWGVLEYPCLMIIFPGTADP